MIVRIDHVAVSATDLAAGAEALAILGYSAVLVESDIENVSVKRELMHAYSDKQALALLSAGAGVDIELLDHGHRVPSAPHLLPVVGSGLPRMALGDGRVNVGSRVLIPGIFEPLAMPVLVDPARGGGRGGGVEELVLPTPDVIASARFWEQLGFSVSRAADRCLEFRSPLGPAVTRLYLLMDRSAPRWRLDDAGANCIAVVTNSPASETQALAAAGYHVTDLARITINKRPLEVSFVVGPGGEIVELVGVERAERAEGAARGRRARVGAPGRAPASEELIGSGNDG